MTGEHLRQLRTRLDLSQEALARLLGVSFATVNRWENEKGASGPRGAVLVFLQALAEGFRRDPRLPAHLVQWAASGQPYLMHRLFALAYGRAPSTSRRASR